MYCVQTAGSAARNVALLAICRPNGRTVVGYCGAWRCRRRRHRRR